MALYLDQYVFQPGVKSRHRVRHQVIDGMQGRELGGMTIPEVVKEARLEYRFNSEDQRLYILRVLTDPDAP